jgi:hypothetical protein
MIYYPLCKIRKLLYDCLIVYPSIIFKVNKGDSFEWGRKKVYLRA